MDAEKNKGGRPASKIDWGAVELYLKAGCTGVGIADMIGIHPETLYNACERDNKMGFSAYAQQKRESGDDMLRAKQFEVAIEGDRSMLIWLGKQRLGQRDSIEQKQTITVNADEKLIPGLTKDEVTEILADAE